MQSAQPASNNTSDYFKYQDLDHVSLGITIAALALYFAFCCYGIWKCYYAQDGWNDVLREKNLAAEDNPPPTSFSRVAGAIGAYFLTGFFILLGGFVLSRLWFPPGKNNVASTLRDVTDFIWAGAALFAPYAVNQISQIFGARPATAPSSARTLKPGRRRTARRPKFDPNVAGL